MRELANILRVNTLTPILGKDRIELATVENWNVIVEKGKYKEGDLVVYCEYDTLLPIKPEFEFLRKRCYSKKYNGFRIQNMKMGGVFSQGIVFATSILPHSCKIVEGKCVAKELGIRKYDPEEFEEPNDSVTKYGKIVNFLLKFKVFRKIILKDDRKKYPYPLTVKKSDETNIQKTFNWLKEHKPNEKYYLSEKLEGQSSTFMLYGKKKEYRIYSHNTMGFVGDNSNWDIVSKKYNLEKILKHYYKEYGRKIAIQGEIVGPGIQKNIYGFNELQFYVFGIINTDSGALYTYSEMLKFCSDYSLPSVPIYSTNTLLLGSVQEILEQANGESCLKKGVLREGFVWRSMVDSSIGFKAKSPEYLIAWNKKDKTM